MSRVPAPSAIRTPISCARAETVNASRPWMPRPARNTARAAKAPSTRRLDRARCRLPVHDLLQRAHVGDGLLRDPPARRSRGWRAAARPDRRGADDELLRRIADDRTVGHLLGGQIHLGLARPLEAAHPHVAHDAHDRPLQGAELEPPAERVLPRPVPFARATGSPPPPPAVRPVSASPTSRPASSGMPIVSKNPGVTKREARRARRSPGSGSVPRSAPPRSRPA